MLPTENQIIANHNVVADFEKIPPYYLNKVKEMMTYFPGESHSAAYRTGMQLLEKSDSAFACNVGTRELYTNKYLRVNAGGWTGEDIWFTWFAHPSGTRPEASNTIKNLIKEYNDEGYPIHVIGFGWCWDLYSSPSRLKMYLNRIIGRTNRARSKVDPVYGVRWLGTSVGGPDGNRQWGLDSDDYNETANRVCTDTYLGATEEYIEFCKTNGYITKVIFTTGPADSYTGQAGYQGYLKHQYIRNYIAKNPSAILFDYNDILCYDDDGTVTTTTWKGHIYPVISPENLGDGSIGHIGPKGAIRLAKAQWWLLARIAGWDGN